MKKKMMNSKVGKFLCRIVGEETGAVMMEYVIIAVLVAAAAVVGIIYFSRTMNEQGAAATSALAGETKEAVSHTGKAKKEAATGSEKSVEHVEKFSDIKGGN